MADVPWRRVLRSRQGVDDLLAVFLPLLRLVFLHHVATHLFETGPAHGNYIHRLAQRAPPAFRGLGNPAGVVAGAWLLRKTGDMAKARRIMAYLGFAGASGFLAFSTTVHNPLLAMLSVGMASFSNDLVMPGAWAAVMDIGGKYAGSLAGAMNMLGNMGGAISPLAIGYILRWSGNN